MLWGSTFKSVIQPLQIQQNKIVRIIRNVSYNATSRPIYKSLNILPIDNLYKMELAKFMYCHSKHLLPKPLLQLFTANREIHCHNTRAINNPHIPRLNTKQATKSFIYTAPQLWFTIPENVKDAKTVKSFVGKYKTELISRL